MVNLCAFLRAAGEFLKSKPLNVSCETGSRGNRGITKSIIDTSANWQTNWRRRIGINRRLATSVGMPQQRLQSPSSAVWLSYSGPPLPPLISERRSYSILVEPPERPFGLYVKNGRLCVFENAHNFFCNMPVNCIFFSKTASFGRMQLTSFGSREKTAATTTTRQESLATSEPDRTTARTAAHSVAETRIGGENTHRRISHEQMRFESEVPESTGMAASLIGFNFEENSNTIAIFFKNKIQLV